jgi:hypothetical protein
MHLDLTPKNDQLILTTLKALAYAEIGYSEFSLLGYNAVQTVESIDDSEEHITSIFRVEV